MLQRIAALTLAAAAATAAVSVAAPALAQYSGPGALPVATSVQSVLSHPRDDQPVALRGKLVRQLRHEHYMFSDGQDEIEVEVDDELLHGLQVDASTLVEISGEVDYNGFGKPDIDVKVLRLAP